MQGGALASAFDTIRDPKVGIVNALDECPAAFGAPRFLHYSARLCDPAQLGGVATAQTIETAATDRETAVVAALQTGISRYCAALYDRAALPVASAAGAPFPCLSPGEFALFDARQYAIPGFPYVPFADDTSIKWTSAVDLANGEHVHAPAAMVWFPFFYVRTAGDLPIAPGGSAGLGCGEGVADAALAGICDVVAHDAAALFWQAMTQSPCLSLENLPERLRDMVGRFALAGDTLTILDVTTDNRIPAFVALAASDRPARPAHVFAVAADLDARAALDKALRRLAESHRLATATMQVRPKPSPTSDWEDVLVPADHLNFAADHDNRERFAWVSTPNEQRDLRDYDRLRTGSIDGDLEAAVDCIAATGHRVYAANLTSHDVGGLGLNVCRAIVPGYRPLFAGHHLRALGGARLYDVPRKIGHRGITRQGGGNPAPQPFG